MYYTGIDPHTRDCLLTTYDDAGHRVKQQRVPNARERLRQYFTGFTGPHQAVVESTGFWGIGSPICSRTSAWSSRWLMPRA